VGTSSSPFEQRGASAVPPLWQGAAKKPCGAIGDTAQKESCGRGANGLRALFLPAGRVSIPTWTAMGTGESIATASVVVGLLFSCFYTVPGSLPRNPDAEISVNDRRMHACVDRSTVHRLFDDTAAHNVGTCDHRFFSTRVDGGNDVAKTGAHTHEMHAMNTSMRLIESLDDYLAQAKANTLGIDSLSARDKEITLKKHFGVEV
jgi:hypothetical protein